MYVEDKSLEPTATPIRDGDGKEITGTMVRYTARFKSNNPVNTWFLCQSASGFYGAFKHENKHAISVPLESALSTEFCAGMFFKGQDDEIISAVYIDRNMVKDTELVDKFLTGLYKEIENKLNS